jgi:putative hydrolase of the HAD superfamily
MFRESHKGAQVTYTPPVLRDNSIKAVFFDLGDVVIDWPDNTPVYKYVAKRFGLESEGLMKIGEAFVDRVDRGEISEKDMWTQLFSLYGLGLPRDWRTLWVREFKAYGKLDKGVSKITADLSRNGYIVGMITNNEPSHDMWAKKSGWYKNFELIVQSYKVRFIKPEPEIYMIALDTAGVKASESIFVDNKAENVNGAEKVGMKGILFSSSKDKPEKLKRELKRYGIKI